MSVTPPSSWPWLDHPVSGLRPPTESPCSDSLSLRLPYSVKLAGKRKSLTHYTKGTPSSQLDEPSGFLQLMPFSSLRDPKVIRLLLRSIVTARSAVTLVTARNAATLVTARSALTGSISSWRSFAACALTRAAAKNPEGA